MTDECPLPPAAAHLAALAAAHGWRVDRTTFRLGDHVVVHAVSLTCGAAFVGTYWDSSHDGAVVVDQNFYLYTGRERCGGVKPLATSNLDTLHRWVTAAGLRQALEAAS